MFSSRPKSSSTRIARASKATKSSKPGKAAATPLDHKQQALREKEEQLRQATEQLKRLIDEAPRLREEQTRRRRESLANDTRLSSRTSLGDRRYNVSATADSSFGTRRLRSEKRDGKLFFVFLCMVLMAIVYWIFQWVMSHM